ncbi:hypothetical protein V1477_007227 [Vespula maculifrons]|uniref:Uncharacterized protein n=1 Tax=Vespula maculifrons TaxID=7453 RepID=A0ABD2CIU7_VESMC
MRIQMDGDIDIDMDMDMDIDMDVYQVDRQGVIFVTLKLKIMFHARRPSFKRNDKKRGTGCVGGVEVVVEIKGRSSV